MSNSHLAPLEPLFPDQAGREVTVPRSEQWDVCSRGSGRPYRIFVAVPAEEAPPAGHPVIYVLDANSTFGTLAETVRAQSRAKAKTGVDPAVVVGIGYPTDAPFDPARFYDFTLPVQAEELPPHPHGDAWPEMGGAEAFSRFIEEELKPAIERKFNIDRGRQAIIGHSLGGLCVLQMLFTRPGAFKTYIAGSPSIHWNRPFIQEAGERFLARMHQEHADIQVMIAVGEREQGHPSRMTENARELAERLAAVSSSGVRTAFYEFADEGHISLLPVLMSHAARYALSSPGQTG